MLTEVKQAIEDNAVVMPMVAAAAVSTEEASAAEESFAEPSEMAVADIQAGEVLEEVPDSELFAVPELPADDEYEEPDMAELLDSIQEEPVDIPGFDETPEVPEIADIPGLDETPEVPEIADIPGLDEIPEIADIPGLDEIPEVPETAVAKEPEPAPAPSNPNAMMTPEDIAKLLESMGR